MSWATRRRALIFLILFLVLGAGVSAIGIATFYEAPTCSDQKKNQDELEVDCGGSCTLLCPFEARDPVVKFVRAIRASADRTDVIAYVENQNTAAAVRKARYRLDLYGSDNILIASVSGSIALPPVSSIPVFAPRVFSGNRTVARAFLTFPETLSWERYTDSRPKVFISEIITLHPTTTPRVTASVANANFDSLFAIPLVATVFDEAGNAIAVSGTVLERIPPQSSAPAVFTWNVPFAGKPVRVDIVPLIPL